MRKTPIRSLLVTLFMLCALPFAASGQTTSEAHAALEAFPESQGVLYINARRIMHDALPRVMPPAAYQKMLSDVRQGGFDPLTLRYIVGGIRFVEPAPPSGLPEFLVVVNGDFSADALLSVARLIVGSEGGKIRSETYGSKTLQIVDLKTSPVPKDAQGEDGAKEEGSAPTPPPFPEIAAVALDVNTLAVGVPDFVRAAIDAGAGQGRLKEATVALAARDSESLMSLTAVLPEDLPGMLARYGLGSDAEVSRIIESLKQVNLMVGMNAVDFTVRAAFLTGDAEQANAINGLLTFGLTALKEVAAKDAKKRQSPAQARKARAALNVVNTLTQEVDGSTVVVSFSVPQQTVSDLVKEELNKKSVAKKGKAARSSKKRGATRKR